MLGGGDGRYRLVLLAGGLVLAAGTVCLLVVDGAASAGAARHFALAAPFALGAGLLARRVRTGPDRRGFVASFLGSATNRLHERRLRAFATNLPGVVYQFHVRRDGSLWFTYLSEGAGEMLGISPTHYPWRADSLLERIHPDDRISLRATVARATIQLEPWSWDGRLELVPGRVRWLRAASRPTRLPDGRVTWNGLLMDVTDERNAVAALHRREEQLAEAQSVAHVGSWEWNMGEDRVSVSAEHWRIFGYRPDPFEWTYKHFLAAVHPEDVGRVDADLMRSARTGERVMIDYRIIRPDGSQRFVTSRGRAARDRNGRVVRLYGTAQDVTDRMDAAAALEQKVRVERALTRVAQALSETDPGRISAALGLVGRTMDADRCYLFETRADAAGHILDCTHEWHGPALRPFGPQMQGLTAPPDSWWMQQIARPGGFTARVDTLPPAGANGAAFMRGAGLGSLTALALVDPARGLAGILVVGTASIEREWSGEDLRVIGATADMLLARFSRMRAEREVERREGILRAVSIAGERFLRTPDWEVGLDEALALIGEAAGVSRAYMFRAHHRDGVSLVGQIAEWVAPGIEAQMPLRGDALTTLEEHGLGRWEAILHRGEVVHGTLASLPAEEHAWLRQQQIRSTLHIPIQVGEEWWGTLGIDHCREEREWSAAEIDALRSAAGMIAAAIQRTRAGEALHESEERFRQLAESMREVFFLFEPGDGGVIYLSPSFDEVWGRTRDDPEQFAGAVLPEDRDAMQADVRDAAEGRSSGSSPVDYRIIRPDGSMRWIRQRTFPVLDASGRPYRVAGICSDITQQKQLEEELQRTNRIEAIGHLAAGIAHEINTPIQYVGDNLRFLNECYAEVRGVLGAYEALLAAAEKGEPVPADLVGAVREAVHRADLEYALREAPTAGADALDGVRRVAEIVRAMKEFSHPGTGRKSPVDLNRAIRSTITVARNEWRYVARLETDLDEDLPPVPALQGELNQAVLNLIVNAAHAIADRQAQSGDDTPGEIVVRTAARGDHAEIRVSDTGTGIAEGIRGRVFDPFFTTKEVGRGTGQGLTFVHTIVVERHGGTVSFETAPDRGTTFVLRLPLHTKQQPEIRAVCSI